MRLDCVDQRAQQWKARAEALLTRIEETYAPLFSWIASCSDEELSRFLSDPSLTESEFYFRERRARANGDPYGRGHLFGWLFALGLVAEWRRAGQGFFPAYRELLRNSGRMTAERLVQDALGVDIRKRDFWNAALDRAHHAPRDGVSRWLTREWARDPSLPIGRYCF